MKNKALKNVLAVIVILFAAFMLGFYFYDVFCNKTPFQNNLFRLIALICVLISSLLRIFAGQKRKSLDFYEKSYQAVIGDAFRSQPTVRKKLLCATRLYDESNYEKALKYLFDVYKKAQSERDAVPVLLFIALCYTDCGLNDEAIKVYYKLLEFDRKNVTAHSNIGLIFVNEGDFETALKHYNMSIECEPNYYGYVNRANCYFRQGEYDKAVSDAEKALEIKNNGAEAASLLTVIFALKNDKENKEKYFHLAITCGKKPEELKESIKLFLQEKEGINETEENV
ncbi:MAG: tetratricopeptide repeat protein [Clostridia bacterium]|nr:tetratricopeptide repeat protein [Clostridia bacterium]